MMFHLECWTANHNAEKHLAVMTLQNVVTQNIHEPYPSRIALVSDTDSNVPSLEDPKGIH